MKGGATFLGRVARRLTADNGAAWRARGRYYSKDLRIRSGLTRVETRAAASAEQEFSHRQDHVGEGDGADLTVGGDDAAALIDAVHRVG